MTKKVKRNWVEEWWKGNRWASLDHIEGVINKNNFNRFRNKIIRKINKLESWDRTELINKCEVIKIIKGD